MIGLVNVATEDGRHFFDLTQGQLRYMAAKEGWDVRRPPTGEGDEAK